MKAWLLLADHQNYQRAGFIAESIPSNPRSACRLGKVGRTESSSKERNFSLPSERVGAISSLPINKSRPGEMLLVLLQAVCSAKGHEKTFPKVPFGRWFLSGEGSGLCRRGCLAILCHCCPQCFLQV